MVLGVREMIRTDSIAYIFIYCHGSFANLYFKYDSHKVTIIMRPTVIYVGSIAIRPNAVTPAYEYIHDTVRALDLNVK